MARVWKGLKCELSVHISLHAVSVSACLARGVCSGQREELVSNRSVEGCKAEEDRSSR